MRTRGARFAGLAVLLAAGALGISAGSASAGQEFVGVTSDETFVAVGAQQHSNLPGIARTGVGTIRQTLNWEFLEYGQAPGTLNYVFLDRFIGACAQRGIRVLPVLFNPPAHRTTRPAQGAERGTYPPADLGDIGNFGAQLARRYGSNGGFWNEHPELPRLPIVAWQIWNEPNLPVYWRPRPDPGAYATMLRLASERIKTVDPSAEVVTAGLPESHIKDAMSLPAFLRGMYAAGANGAFDTFALNGYARTGRGVARKVGRYRRMLNSFGDADAGIRLTEFGWADRGPERPKARYTAGRRRQGRYIAQAIRGLWRKRGALGFRGLVYYAWRDQRVYAGGKNFWGLHTGLHYRNGRAKPALRAFKRAVRSLR
jgi:hypothetical protein